MPYYIPDLVSKTTCIGNTLSTFNISFSNLDTRLYQLSTYTVNSVNFLSSTMISVSSVLNNRINFLSSAIISVSSDLRTQIFNTSSETLTQLNYVSSFLRTEDVFLSSSINYVSANVVDDYISQGVLTNNSGIINWDFSTVGNNAKIWLSSDAHLNNPTGLIAGQTGNLIVKIDVLNATLTSFGNLWTFTGAFSSLNNALSAKNILSYYYDGEEIISNLITL
jgi:hypothetical protein